MNLQVFWAAAELFRLGWWIYEDAQARRRRRTFWERHSDIIRVTRAALSIVGALWLSLLTLRCVCWLCAKCRHDTGLLSRKMHVTPEAKKEPEVVSGSVIKAQTSQPDELSCRLDERSFPGDRSGVQVDGLSPNQVSENQASLGDRSTDQPMGTSEICSTTDGKPEFTHVSAIDEGVIASPNGAMQQQRLHEIRLAHAGHWGTQVTLKISNRPPSFGKVFMQMSNGLCMNVKSVVDSE